MAGSGRKVRERLNDRPRRILDEAIRIIGLRGYFGFSVRELAENCGLTVPGVLHHFGSKEGLLVALLEDRDLRDAQLLFGGVDVPERPLSFDELKQLLHRVAERNREQPEIIRLYSMLRTESLGRDHPAHRYFQERGARAMQTLLAQIGDQVAHPQSSALQLLAVMAGLEDLWLRNPDEIDFVAEWDRAVSAILD